MSLIQVIIYALIALGPIPDKIYFHDGRWLSNTARLRLARGILLYPHPLNEVFRVPSTWLDLARTLRPKPPQSKAATAYKGIPWDHPAFAKKTKSAKPIALTTEGLSSYVEKFPRRIYEAGPEPEPCEDPFRLLEKRSKKQVVTPKPPKPEKSKGSGRKRKQTRRSKALGEDDSFFEDPSEAESEPEASLDKSASPHPSKPLIQQSLNQGEHGRIVAPALRMRRWSPHRPDPVVEWLFSMPLPAPLGHGGLGWNS